MSNSITLRALEKALRPHPLLKRKLVTGRPLDEAERELLQCLAFMHGEEAVLKVSTSR